jgi:hypothetical protein
MWSFSLTWRQYSDACLCPANRPALNVLENAVKTNRLLAIAGAGLIVAGAGSAVAGGARADAAQDRRLGEQAAVESKILSDHFEKARLEVLKAAQSPSFAAFYALPGTRDEKLAAGGPVVQKIQTELKELEAFFPNGMVSEVCFINGTGQENARVVDKLVAEVSDLSEDETVSPFFSQTLSTKVGQVYQAKPYISPDTNEWVVSNSTLMPVGDRNALLHFEVSLESFRKLMTGPGLQDAIVIERTSGDVILDFDHKIEGTGKLVSEDEANYSELQRSREVGAAVTLNGERLAFNRVKVDESNANDWILVTKDKAPTRSVPLIASLGAGAAGLIALMLSVVVGRRKDDTAQTTPEREMVSVG